MVEIFLLGNSELLPPPKNSDTRIILKKILSLRLKIKLLQTKNLNMAVKENAAVRELIINSMDNDILKDYLNVTSSFIIMERLTRKYGGDKNDLKYWIKKLNSLKAKSLSEVTTALEDISDIFEQMKENGLTISYNEKIKFLYLSMPKSFREILEITQETTSSQLINCVKNRLTMKADLEDWTINEEEETPNDQMDIDGIFKPKKNIFRKTNNNQINKN
eukprot:jgi/Orpsp1_1/1184431/evm.model.c7180000089480.1